MSRSPSPYVCEDTARNDIAFPRCHCEAHVLCAEAIPNGAGRTQAVPRRTPTFAVRGLFHRQGSDPTVHRRRT